MKQCKTFFLLITWALLGLPGTAFADDYPTSNDHWTDIGNFDTDWYDFNTTGDNYEISTAADLAGLAKLVNDGTDSFAGKTIKLMQPIDLRTHYWTPIGGNDGNDYATRTATFQGFFDGNHKTISNLYVDDSGKTTAFVYTGLFGYIYSEKDDFTAGVKNLTLEGGGVKGGKGKEGVLSMSFTGALAGYVWASADNGVTAGIAITGITSSVTVSVKDAISSRIGGIVGYGYGSGADADICTFTLSGCVNTGTVTGEGTNPFVGGIIGQGQGDGIGQGYGTFTLSGCVNAGTVTGKGISTYTGGIIGSGAGFGYDTGTGTFTLSGCINTGTVTGEGSTGGIIGRGGGHGHDTSTGTFTLSGCVNTGTVTGEEDTGGIIGRGYSGATDVGTFTLSDSYNTGKITASAGYAGGVGGYIHTDMVAFGPGTGYGTASVRNCWSSGAVNGTGTDGLGTATVGGVVGWLDKRTDAVHAPVVENCLAIPASLTGAPTADVHRIVGLNTGGTLNLRNNYAYVSSKPDDDDWTKVGAADLDGESWKLPADGSEWKAENPFTGWGFNTTEDAANPWLKEPVGIYYPILNTVPKELQPRVLLPLSFDGTGTENDPFRIKTRIDLDLLSHRVNIDYEPFAGQYFRLEPTDGQTLDMGTELFTPIGGHDGNGSDTPTATFQGFFDGNHKTISNLYVDDSGKTTTFVCTGLFGYIYSGKDNFTAGVKNLTLEGGEVKGGGPFQSYTGALAGCVWASAGNGITAGIAITGITSSVTVSAKDAINSCIGGIVGYGYGNGVGTVTFTLSGCVNTGTVTGEGTNPHIGGIIGQGHGNGSGQGIGTFTLSSCVNAGTVTGKGISTGIGGIIGQGQGNGYGSGTGTFTLSGCINTGTVTGEGDTGGIIGRGGGSGHDTGIGTFTLSDSYNTGKITASAGYAGGVGGYITTDKGPGPAGSGNGTASVRNCWSSGAVNGTGTDGLGTATVGGVVGWLVKDIVATHAPVVENCLAIPASLTGALTADVHRIVGLNTNGTLSNNYAYVSSKPDDDDWTKVGAADLDGESWKLPTDGSEWKAENPFTGWGFNTTEDAANPWLKEPAGIYYPILNTVPKELQPRVLLPLSFDGTGTENDPFRIKTRIDLDFLSHRVNIDYEPFAGQYFRLEPTDGQTLDMGTELFTPIGNAYNNPFRGNFDGYGNIIAGLRIDLSGETDKRIYAGLFGYIAAFSYPVTIKNLILQGGEVTGGGSGEYSFSYTGALAGHISNLGKEVYIKNCHTLDVTVSGGTDAYYSYTGGLAGNSSGSSMTSCLNSGTIISGKGTNEIHTGGLTGTGTNTSITNCYNTGTVQAAQGHAGGLAGYMVTNENITDCWSSGSVEGGADVIAGGLIGELRQNGGTPSLTGCIAIPDKLTGKTDNVGRITGINTGGTLANNYAYIPGTWADKGHDKPNGADWNGLMTSPPVAGYDANIWQIDPTHAVMPKLTDIAESLQPDVANPFFSKKITVTFDMQGAPDIAPQTVGLGQKITRPSPDPDYEGHTFEGWFAEAACTTPFDFDYTVNGLSGDTVIYAQWTLNTYTVTLPSYQGIRYDRPAGDYTVGYGSTFTFSITKGGAYSQSALKVSATNGHEVRLVNSLTNTYQITIKGETEIIIEGIELNVYTVTIESTGGAIMLPVAGEYKVRIWDDFRFTLRLLNEYSNSTPVVKVDGVELPYESYKDLMGGEYTYYIKSVTEDLYITIEGIDRNVTSSPELTPQPPKGGAKVWTTPGQIHVSIDTPLPGGQGVNRVRIYTVAGQLILNSPLSTLNYKVPAGTYIVVVGRETFKVSVNH